MRSMSYTAFDQMFDQLNDESPPSRLDALRSLMRMHERGELASPATGNNVNNHIHTFYSFSPYSPSKAVYLAWSSGLATAGIIDHDSVAGAREFIEAGSITGLPVTVGFECRCSFKGTPFEGRRLNNPDQLSIAYVTLHGIPHKKLEEADFFMKPYREKRIIRNRLMLDRLNRSLTPFGLELDFDADILPLSHFSSGGVVTERHILYALASELTGDELSRQFLLGLFKSHLIESIYVDADDELPHITEFVTAAERLGAIPAYAYLGDVGLSVTGDKKARAFEDSYLGELLMYLKEIGMKAVTYMPARNTETQLARIKALCEAYGFFQISGEDINSPMQKFICEKIETPGFMHLIDSAWALIGHELATDNGISRGMFSKSTEKTTPNLDERVKYFAGLAREHYKSL